MSNLLNKILFISLALVGIGATGIFAYSSSRHKLEWTASEQGCELSDLELSGNFAVYGVDAKSPTYKLPYPIDDSASIAGQIDVVVNSPSQPVILILGHYNPAVWKIQRTKNTQIAGAVIYGYYSQEIVGLAADTPTLINTFEQCREDKSFTSIRSNKYSTSDIIAERLFGLPLDELFRDVESVGSDRFYVVGESIEEDTALVSSQDTSVESFFVSNAPRVGSMGLEDAVEAGKLRPFTQQDYETLAEAYIKNRESASPEKLFPTAQKRQEYKDDFIYMLGSVTGVPKNYVVIDNNFTYPAGLWGAGMAVFLIDEGVSLPEGDSGHSVVFDSQGNALSIDAISLIARQVDDRVGIVTAPPLDSIPSMQ